MSTKPINISVLVYDNAYANNSSLTNVPVNLTSIEFWILLLFFYIFFAGIVTNIFNTAIWVGILRKKDLRTRFFVMIGFLTFCRTCSCTNMLVAGVFRSLGTAGIVSFYQRRIYCHLLSFWLINGFVLEQILLLVLVVDRMIAIMAANYYRLLTDRSAAQVCLSLYLIVTIIVLGPSYAFDNMLEYAPCVNTDSFLSPYFSTYKKNLSFAVVCVIFVLYCVLIFYVRLRAKAIQAVAYKSDAAKVALQRHLKLMPMFRNIVLMHCGFAFSSRLLNMLATFVSPEYAQRFIALGGIFNFLDIFLNMISLLTSNSDIRKAALPCWRKNRVTSIQESGSGRGGNVELKAYVVKA